MIPQQTLICMTFVTFVQKLKPFSTIFCNFQIKKRFVLAWSSVSWGSILLLRLIRCPEINTFIDIKHYQVTPHHLHHHHHQPSLLKYDLRVGRRGEEFYFLSFFSLPPGQSEMPTNIHHRLNFLVRCRSQKMHHNGKPGIILIQRVPRVGS